MYSVCIIMFSLKSVMVLLVLVTSPEVGLDYGVAHEFGKDVDLEQCFINEKDKVEFVSIRNEPALRLNFSPSSFFYSLLLPNEPDQEPPL